MLRIKTDSLIFLFFLFRLFTFSSTFIVKGLYPVLCYCSALYKTLLSQLDLKTCLSMGVLAKQTLSQSFFSPFLHGLNQIDGPVSVLAPSGSGRL